MIFKCSNSEPIEVKEENLHEEIIPIGKSEPRSFDEILDKAVRIDVSSFVVVSVGVSCFEGPVDHGF